MGVLERTEWGVDGRIGASRTHPTRLSSYWVPLYGLVRENLFNISVRYFIEIFGWHSFSITPC